MGNYRTIKKEKKMTNTKIKWFNEDYDLGCDVSKLEELGFTNSSWKDDIAPSFANDKMQIYFLNRKKFKEHEGRSMGSKQVARVFYLRLVASF
jgi:hypothetical protein